MKSILIKVIRIFIETITRIMVGLKMGYSIIRIIMLWFMIIRSTIYTISASFYRTSRMLSKSSMCSLEWTIRATTQH